MSRTHSMSHPTGITRPHVIARVAAAALGGYVLGWGVAAALTSLLFAAGVDFHDAEFLGMLAGVLAYLGALLWVFAARRLMAAWWALAGGGTSLAVLGSLVQSLLA